MKTNKEKISLVLQIVFVVGLSFLLKYGIVIIAAGLIIIFYGVWQIPYTYWLGRDKAIETTLENKLNSKQANNLTSEEKDILHTRKLTSSIKTICLKVGASLVAIGIILLITEK